jgi:hypothetical protein
VKQGFALHINPCIQNLQRTPPSKVIRIHTRSQEPDRCQGGVPCPARAEAQMRAMRSTTTPPASHKNPPYPHYPPQHPPCRPQPKPQPKPPPAQAAPPAQPPRTETSINIHKLHATNRDSSHHSIFMIEKTCGGFYLLPAHSSTTADPPQMGPT